MESSTPRGTREPSWRRGTRALLCAPLLVLAASAALPAGAEARGCTSSAGPGFVCGRLTVPLDRSGRVPGQVHLFVAQRPGPAPGPNGALFALAGGPGQAATPFAADLADVLAPAVGNRRLVVFDERGTGRSDPLFCMPGSNHGGPP